MELVSHLHDPQWLLAVSADTHENAIKNPTQR
jgi:hypothetical protein